jgi:hypothetical protein
MSLSFQRYQDEFETLTKQIESSVQQQENGGDIQVKSSSSSESTTTSNLSTCDELLQQMALEARSVSDSGLKRELLTQVRNSKASLQALKERYDRQALMNSNNSSNGGGGGPSSSAAHRERLLHQQDSLSRQNSQLEHARRVMEETEQVALEITSELGHNRETLEQAHGRIRQVTSLTGRARRIVSSMNQRAVQQKLLLYGISASIIVVFCWLVWWLRY